MLLRIARGSCRGIRNDRVRQKISSVGLDFASCSGSRGGRSDEFEVMLSRWMELVAIELIRFGR